MSGMFDSKSDKAGRKLARTQKEEKARRKSRITIITVISVLLLVSAFAITINSNFIRRTLPVVTIDGIGFSAAKFEFFVNSEYIDFVNMMSQFQGSDGLPQRPLSGKVRYENPETGEKETWAEFFIASALMRMTNFVSVYNAAKEAGFELSDEHYDQIEFEITMAEMEAIMNQHPSLNSLLQLMYGHGMNEKLYREILEFTTLISAYSEFVRESFSFTADEKYEFYSEHRNDFDVFGFRIFYVNPEHIDPSEYESGEDYTDAREAAIEEARARAAKIVADGINSAEEFIAAAEEEYGHDADWLGEVVYRSGETLDEIYKDWLLSESRSYGDVTSFDTDSGAIVIYYASRDGNDYPTVGMRQILIKREPVNPEMFPEGENDPEYIAALELSDAEANERAEHVLSLFIAAGKTEEALIGLMEEYQQDGSIDGEYLNITKYTYQSSHFRAMKVVPEIEEWLFDESRTVGDSALINSKDHGYHLVYFIGYGDLFFELIAEDKLRTRDHSEWLESLPEGTPVKHASFILVSV